MTVLPFALSSLFSFAQPEDGCVGVNYVVVAVMPADWSLGEAWDIPGASDGPRGGHGFVVVVAVVVMASNERRAGGQAYTFTPRIVTR